MNWDTYQINATELWYYVIYPILLPILIPIMIMVIPLISSLIAVIGITYSIGYSIFILLGGLTIITAIDIIVHEKWKTSSVIDLFFKDPILQLYLFSIAACGIYYIINISTSSYASSYVINPTTYEHFDNSPNIAETLQTVQHATQSLQNSLDTLDQATDDTCSVITGIEKKFIDNITAPSGDGDPPSKEEAATIKAQKLPGATKQWNQKLQDWADTHGQIPVVECFDSGSLSDLVDANQQLSNLLASAPVQRVITQVKRLQTSDLFAQKYINDLANQFTQQESFDNPTPEPTLEDTITTSNKLVQQANDIEAQIQSILASTSQLKNNYAALNAKANDPNTVNNLAQSTSS